MDLFSNEIFLEIFSKLSLVDILNLSKVSKQWYHLSQDEFLWKRLLERDFSLTSKEEETYQEEFQFQMRWNSTLVFKALDQDDSRLAKYSLSYLKIDYEAVFRRAAQRNDPKILEIVLEKLLTDLSTDSHERYLAKVRYYNKALTFTNDLDMAKFIMNKREGGDVWYQGLSSAIRKGNKEIATFLLEQVDFKNDYTLWLFNAASKSREILDICLEKVPFNVISEEFKNRLLVTSGDLTTINLMIERLVDPTFDYKTFLVDLVQSGHSESIIKVFNHIDENDLQINSLDVWEAAGGAGREEIIKLLFNHLEFDPEYDVLVLEMAVGHKHVGIVKLLLKIFNERNIIVQYSNSLEIAAMNGYHEIFSLLLKQMRNNDDEPDYHFISEFNYEWLPRIPIRDMTQDIEIIRAIINDMVKYPPRKKYLSWVSNTMYVAAEYSYQGVVEGCLKILKRGNFQIGYMGLLYNAVRRRSMGLVRKILKEQDRFDFDRVIPESIQSGSLALFKTILSLTSKTNLCTEYDSYLKIAIEHNYPHIANYILKLMNGDTSD